ncbi:MAG: PA0069 family radical SAM protein [Phycisphaerales bacterium]|nr:PA0069 family radical SAM protein [Phycisphaerales bacterium]
MRLRVVDNPPSPYTSRYADWLEPPPDARVEVYEETARSILSRNDSPDIPFTWSVNPYRGCQHACAYCYARPTHEYLEFGAGTDFETRLVAKVNAPQLLRAALVKPRWRRERICFCGVTDCYQPIEATYGLTRRCLEVCLEFRNPVGVITKGFLVVRDIDLLTRLAEQAGASVHLSIPFADPQTSKLLEPQAPPPSRRFEALRRLAEAGLDVSLMLSPIIPGLNDTDIPEILERAAEAGATSASYSALRLPGSVEPVFVERLRAALPQRAEKVLARIRDMRGGRMNETRFGARMRGEGVYWTAIRHLFAVTARRFGLGAEVAAVADIPAAAPPEEPARALPTQLQLDF